VQRFDQTLGLAELSVCGDVHRYQRIPDSFGWLDVTLATAPRPAPAS
jgi:hypothetical protein